MDKFRHIDKLVAEHILGWEVTGDGDYLFSEDAPIDCPTCGYDGKWRENELPYFSQYIEDAWLVINQLRKDGFYSYHTDLTMDSEQEWWSWHFTKGVNSFSKQADSAPLAICLSALLVKGLDITL